MRVEAKYHLDTAGAFWLAEELRGSGFALDEHCREPDGYTVSSIYLDDPALSAFHTKLDGLPRRAKVRLRFHAEELGDGPVRLEHKEKDAHLSWKRVEWLEADDVRRYVATGSGPVADRIDPEAGALAPVLCIQYQRLAFLHPVHAIRINFDTRVRWRSVDPALPGLLSGARHEPLAADQVILEVKVPREFAGDVADLVHRWNLHWRATSKYAICIEHMQRCLLES